MLKCQTLSDNWDKSLLPDLLYFVQSYKKKRAKRKKRNPFLLVCSLYWVFDVNLNANAAVRIDKNLSEKHQYTAVNLTFFTLLRPKMHNMQVAWLCFGKILRGFLLCFRKKIYLCAVNGLSPILKKKLK